jgi:hypothetical protein
MEGRWRCPQLPTGLKLSGKVLEGFDRLTVAIGRSVAGTFSTTKGEDAIRAADTPPRQGQR